MCVCVYMCTYIYVGLDGRQQAAGNFAAASLAREFREPPLPNCQSLRPRADRRGKGGCTTEHPAAGG